MQHAKSYDRQSLQKSESLLINPCHVEQGLSFFENTVDQDQMASDEAI